MEIAPNKLVDILKEGDIFETSTEYNMRDVILVLKTIRKDEKFIEFYGINIEFHNLNLEGGLFIEKIFFLEKHLKNFNPYSLYTDEEKIKAKMKIISCIFDTRTKIHKYY